MNNRFVIVTPFYNAEEWVHLCVRSVLKQTYENYRFYLIDDLSTDETCGKIEAEIKDAGKVTLIRNTDKKYALKNISDTISSLELDDEDIIVILDGDDWLASQDVLHKLNDIYNEDDCWMTYGSYMEYPSGVRGKFAKKIPDHIIKRANYRQSEWMSSHLRTFKYKLWKKIDQKDFIFSRTGKFVKAAWDLAFVFPMLEMSGNRAKYVKDILYIYNRQNPLNEDKVDHPSQLSEEMEIRSKKRYEYLEKI